jgi:hypothetical protein
MHLWITALAASAPQRFFAVEGGSRDNICLPVLYLLALLVLQHRNFNSSAASVLLVFLMIIIRDSLL